MCGDLMGLLEHVYTFAVAKTVAARPAGALGSMATCIASEAIATSTVPTILAATAAIGSAPDHRLFHHRLRGCGRGVTISEPPAGPRRLGFYRVKGSNPNALVWESARRF